MAKKTPGQVFVAENGVVRWQDGRVRLRVGDPWPADDPLVKAFPSLFTEVARNDSLDGQVTVGLAALLDPVPDVSAAWGRPCAEVLAAEARLAETSERVAKLAARIEAAEAVGDVDEMLTAHRERLGAETLRWKAARDAATAWVTQYEAERARLADLAGRLQDRSRAATKLIEILTAQAESLEQATFGAFRRSGEAANRRDEQLRRLDEELATPARPDVPWLSGRDRLGVALLAPAKAAAK